MTEPTALAQLRHLYQNMVNGAVRDTASAKRIAEGLLAPAIEALERGTPPAVAGEPVFAFRRKGLDDFCTCTEERYAELSAKPNLFETRIFYTTPQPAQAQSYTPCRKNPFYHGPRNCIRGTVGCCEDHGAKPQAQAVAVPLTDGQIEAATGAKIGTPLFLAAKGFVLATEAAHGIKGGQHGTE